MTPLINALQLPPTLKTHIFSLCVWLSALVFVNWTFFATRPFVDALRISWFLFVFFVQA